MGGEVRDRGAIDDIEALLGKGLEEVAGKANGFPDASLAVLAIERGRRADAVTDGIAIEHSGSALPVPPGDKVNFVSGRQSVAQFVVPLLGPSPGKGVQGVVDEGDLHGGGHLLGLQEAHKECDQHGVDAHDHHALGEGSHLGLAQRALQVRAQAKYGVDAEASQHQDSRCC